MSDFTKLSDQELAAELASLEAKVEELRALNLSLDMTRGKPSNEQVDISKPMLDALTEDSDLHDGPVDAGNYGTPDGIASARKLFGEILNRRPEDIVIGGASSLNIEFDCVAHAFVKGVRGNTPWFKQGHIKFLCPAPGYDRHFGVSAHFGIENIPVPMTLEGPDMDMIEELVNNDPTVKGVWCVPMYQNPMGITFSDEVVRRFAALRPAAPDFRIYWDNAYCVHDFNDTPDHMLDIFECMEEAGTKDLVYEFASTSKVTFPGSGMGCVTASPEDLDDLRATFGTERVSNDKITQLMHSRFLPDLAALRKHMAKQAELVRPRFEMVERKLQEGLSDLDCVTWTHPNGGYFVSFDGPKGSAAAIVGLAAELGVKMTAAGATWPYKNDPADSNIRIAPTFPSLEELSQALDVFVVSVRYICARLESERRA